MKELKGCYSFFYHEANLKEESMGYGLVRDKSVFAPEIASIASVGYSFAAIVIGVKRNWMCFEEGYYRCYKTLETFQNHVEGLNGFYYHFVNMDTGKREWNCELSIIDTGILICGALLAGEFFGGGVRELAEELYKKINWQWYRNKESNTFYMGYLPEKGFEGTWDMYATCTYEGVEDIIYTYCGTLFTYQFSHAWINFMNTEDENGIDWFENSIKASLANRAYCIKYKEKYKTFGENSWGLTACVGPKGYSGGFGALPSYTNLEIENDGTIPPCGAIGSIVFTPKESMKAMEYYYHSFPKLWCKYGFRDSYNLEGKKPWYSKECIGIDKGISLIMIENYLSGTIWNYFMKNTYVKKGLKKLGIHKKTRKQWGRKYETI